MENFNLSGVVSFSQIPPTFGSMLNQLTFALMIINVVLHWMGSVLGLSLGLSFEVLGFWGYFGNKHLSHLPQNVCNNLFRL